MIRRKKNLKNKKPYYSEYWVGIRGTMQFWERCLFYLEMILRKSFRK